VGGGIPARGKLMNISELVKDWGGFEKLVAALHETGDVTVEHNVVLQGRSGAPRQIDVLLKHKQGLYEHLVIVECKYWNTAVERLHVDALATTVKEVRASKGVMFSTKGFQSGAATQAEHDGIDLFTVRELTDEEWGLPGKVIDLFLHVNSVSIANPQICGAYGLQHSGSPSIHLDIHLGDPNTDTKTPAAVEGALDTTLEEFITRKVHEAANKIYLPRAVKFPSGHEGSMQIRVKVNIEPKTSIKLFILGSEIFVPKISVDIGVKISQSRIIIDRSNPYIFALAIQDCIRNKAIGATRKANESNTILVDTLGEVPPNPDDVIKNGALITVWMKGFMPFESFSELPYGKWKFLPNDVQ
jgi:hypothetical protein